MPDNSRLTSDTLNNIKWYQKLAYHLYNRMWASLDLLFPPNCGGCGATGSRWCGNCQKSIRLITPPWCERCGEQIAIPGLCQRCAPGASPEVTIRSWAYHEGPLRNAILRLKYHRDLTLGSILAAPLVEFLVKLNWSVEIVLPVPLGVARLQERGYNQAAILARPIALGAGRVYMSNALFKVKETSTQVGLTYIQRRENVKGAFRATEALVGGRSVLIIDDVATSKATLYACAEALIASGARRVYGLTLARAGHSSTSVA